MTHTQQPGHVPLEQGQIIPAFSLPAADGMPHGPWDYKQRDHLLLLFPADITRPATHELLYALTQRYSALREEMCALLVVTASPVLVNREMQDELRLPFPLLADPDGKVIARYTLWNSETHTPTTNLLLADRYGALYQQWTATDEAELPPIAELLDILQYLNRLCTP